MYAIEDLSIHEPDPNIPGDKKTICARVRCDGYEADLLSPTPELYGRGEVGSSCVWVTVPFTDDERVLARRIRDKIAEMKVDRSKEKLLLGKIRQLGPSALNK